jgi:hypothetical protein
MEFLLGYGIVFGILLILYGAFYAGRKYERQNLLVASMTEIQLLQTEHAARDERRARYFRGNFSEFAESETVTNTDTEEV